MTVDPTPTARDLGAKKPKTAASAPAAPRESAPIDLGARPTPEAQAKSIKDKSHHDTVLQFAAVELNGNIKKQ